MLSPARGAALFALVGPLLEVVVGPFVLTGFEVGGAPPRWLAPLGALLVLAGAAVLLDTYRRFTHDGRGTPSPAAPPQELVITGAYRHVRHPQYVATATVLAGEGLLLSQLILFAAAGAYLAALATLSRVVEEPLLRKRFGARFDAYRADVPGWLPRARRPG